MGRLSDLDRFAAKVDFTDTCWEWRAVRHQKGYGQFRWNGSMRQAHRWLYERVVGPIPEGLEMDHLCKNRGCVNPDHLEPVTHAENVRRAASPSEALRRRWAAYHARVTHCSKGHEFTPENTIRKPGSRICRKCNNSRGGNSPRR